MIFVLNLADASAAVTYGEPPALFTTTSRLPWLATTVSINAATAWSSRTSQAWNS